MTYYNFVVIASLVLELVGGSFDPPSGTTVSENMHLRFLRVRN